MRDNYFEKKLELTKDNLAWTIQEIKNIEIQMERAKIEFDEKIRTGNEGINRLESIQSKAKKDIKHYEDMIEKGYKFIDIRTGKAYKTEANLQQQFLSEKTPVVEPPEDFAISEEVRKIELELENKRQEKARLKAERKARQRAEAEALKRRQEEVRIKVEAEAKRRLEQAKRIREAEESARIAEEKRIKEEAENIAKEEAKRIKETFIIESKDNELEKMKATRNQIQQVKEELNNKISNEEKDKLWIETTTQGQTLANLYKQQEGGNAIWNGVVTKGFRTFCKENNLKIGD